ncbi:unnamed protein product (macronuclear) [Paramecium tetraurelia]|uniref:Uncharacterized protein n=1 Tax=Paramecium tetraurelia TaxID=5888 RepID=A0DQR2_PARTE|nr:uncharacterized protein GSPATT00002779001 [Paramecium tetraurelia]CAK85379.1 unnamed protein product [Paramecium tetraurelia]|eukprot:XP_001452776.1 hypothetical protein (macronuclear) [Paramecium tetraurelia strain d4-2]
MNDKFLQLRNNYCYQYNKRIIKNYEQPQYSQRLKTETPPILKQNKYTYHSPRNIIQTTFFDQLKKFPTPKPTAYQTYLKSLLENKTEIQSKQKFKPSFTMHDIRGQKINTQRQLKDTLKNQQKHHYQNKTEFKMPQKIKQHNSTQFNQPQKLSQEQMKQLSIKKINKINTKINTCRAANGFQALGSDGMQNYEDNFDDIQPWNTSELK